VALANKLARVALLGELTAQRVGQRRALVNQQLSKARAPLQSGASFARRLRAEIAQRNGDDGYCRSRR
jgi:hypothetical protein